MREAIHYLLELQKVAEESGNADLSSWLSDGISDYFYCNVPLEAALGLAAEGKGKHPARREYMEHKRNAALRAAWRLCDGETDWAKSVMLGAEVDYFQRELWPQWRKCSLSNLPTNTTDLRLNIFIAHQYGLVPASLIQLHRIATQ